MLAGCPTSNKTAKCNYARNAKTYVNTIIPTACSGRPNLVCLLTG